MNRIKLKTLFNDLFHEQISCCYNMRKTSHSTYAEPLGYDTNIVIYNSAVKKKVKFITKKEKIVSWYSCGPTVYDTAHIGNFCSYMRFDIIRRIMVDYFGLNVIKVMNITDIDDKIIAKSKKLNVDFKSVSNCFKQEFLEDMEKLNILSPNIIANVTDNIPEIIEFIECLVENGYGYTTSDGSVYFKVNKYAGYGKFQSIQSELSNDPLKDNSQDFALWKSAKPGEPYWKSPWGKGRPGWHIECSAIASAMHINFPLSWGSKFLGESIDLHSGGIDLKFPHHENEEAQCCARYGKSQWANYWIHAGHLHVNINEKMSKSLNNTITIKDFLNEYSANTLRTLCLTIPYRNNLEFRQETIEQAVAIERKFSHFLHDISSYLRGKGGIRATVDEPLIFKEIETTRNVIKESLSDDFDTNRVLTQLIHLMSVTNANIKTPNAFSSGSQYALAATYNLINNTLQKLGYTFSQKESVDNTTMERLISYTINFRNKVRETALTIKKTDSQELVQRKKVLLESCDAIREDLLETGIELKDFGKSTTWNYIDSKMKSSVKEK